MENDDGARRGIRQGAHRDGAGAGGRRSSSELFARRVGVPCLLLVALGCSSLPQAAPPASPEMIEQQRAEIARSLVETGSALAAQGDTLRAEQYFRAALGAGAPARDVLPRLISVCIKGQRYRAAAADAQEFLRQHPSATRVRFVLASLLTGLGDFPAAVDELVRLVSLDPDHVLGHYALGVLYRDRLNHAERADQEFRAYLHLAPTGSHAEEARASLLQPVHTE
jgi:tetratricopeptide (TPR) repeat protein